MHVIRKQMKFFIIMLFIVASIFMLLGINKIVFAKPIDNVEELANFKTKATFSDLLNNPKITASDLGKVTMTKVKGKPLYNIYIEYKNQNKLIPSQEIPYVGKTSDNKPLYPERITGYFYTSTMTVLEFVNDKGDTEEKNSFDVPWIAYTMEIEVNNSKKLKKDFKAGQIKSFASWTLWNLKTGDNYTQDKIKFWGFVSEEKTVKGYTRASVWELEKNDKAQADKLQNFVKNKGNYSDTQKEELQKDYDFWYNEVKTDIKDYYLNLATPYPMQNLTMINFDFTRTKLAARKNPKDENSGYLNPAIKDETKRENYFRQSDKKVMRKAPEFSQEFINLSYSPIIAEGEKAYKKGKKIVVDNAIKASIKIALVGVVGALFSIHNFQNISDGKKIMQEGMRLVKQGERSILSSKIHNLALEKGLLQGEVAEIEKIKVSYGQKVDFVENYNDKLRKENDRRDDKGLPSLKAKLLSNTEQGINEAFGLNKHYFKIYLDSLDNYDYVGYKYTDLEVVELCYEIFGKKRTVVKESVDVDDAIDFTEDPEKWNLDPHYEENQKVLEDARKNIKEAEERITERNARASWINKLIFGTVSTVGIIVAIIIGVVVLKYLLPRRRARNDSEQIKTFFIKTDTSDNNLPKRKKHKYYDLDDYEDEDEIILAPPKHHKSPKKKTQKKKQEEYKEGVNYVYDAETEQFVEAADVKEQPFEETKTQTDSNDKE